jgi:hypothetical protein
LARAIVRDHLDRVELLHATNDRAELIHSQRSWRISTAGYGACSIDRSLRIFDLHDDSGPARDRAYWLAQTPQARIAAVKRLRNEYYGITADGDFPWSEPVVRMRNLGEE